MIKQNSLLFCKLFIAALGLCLLCGCFAGLGDWSYPIGDGYSIVRVNGHGIQLVYKVEGEDSGPIVIDKFYITDFSRDEDYIGLQGIPTTDIWASDEELSSDIRVFYLISVKDGTVLGPFENAEVLIEYSEALACWQSTRDIPKELYGN